MVPFMASNLSPFMQDLLQTHSLKEDSTKDYKRLWSHCYRFFAEMNIYPPYNGNDIMSYLEALCHQKVGKTTPKKMLRAINWMHQIQGWPVPGAGLQQMQIQRAVRAVQSVLPNKGAPARVPLTRGEKSAIISYAQSKIKISGDHWDRNAVILKYTIACGGRMKDIVNLREIDVKWVTEPNLGVKAFFQSSKKDLINTGKWELEYCYQDVNDPLDGVAALLTFMRYNMKLEKRNEPSRAYIFRAFNSKLNISESSIYSIIKKICLECNIDSSLIGTHSFRKTCATERRENGATVAEVGRRLGHSKDSQSTKRYIDLSRGRSQLAIKGTL